MKVTVRDKEYIEAVIRTGCYSLQRYGKMYWAGKPITSKREFKKIVKKFFRKHIHISSHCVLMLTPDIKARHLCKIIDNY